MSSSPLLDQAIAAIEAGQLNQAQVLLAQVLRQNPRDDEAWLWMAEAQTDLARRRDCVQRALALNPASEIGHKMLVELDRSGAPPVVPPAVQAPVSRPVGSPVVAPAPIVTSRVRPPASERDLLEQAATLIERGRKDEGAAVLEQLLAFNPRNETAWLWRAAATSSPVQKRECLDRVLALNPRNKTALKMLAQLPSTYEPAAPIFAADAPVGHSYSLIETWLCAVTRPSLETYTELLDDPDISIGRAYKWTAIAAAVGGAVAALIQVLLTLVQVSHEPGAPQLGSGTVVAVTGFTWVLALVCTVPFYVLGGAVGLSLNAGITHLAGRALGGKGSFFESVYAIAAYMAPLFLVSTTLSVIPWVKLLVFPLGLYQVVLNIVAAKAVQRFGWLPAIVAGLAPVLVSLALLIGIAMVLLSALGPEGLKDIDKILLTLTPAPHR